MTTDTYVVAAGKATIKKDPNAILDYTMNWAAWLGTDTIVGVTWIVDASMALVSSSFTTKTATIFLSGGTTNTTVPLTCRITTASSPTARVDDRTVYLKIVAK
jgi:hypothetical protein